MRCLSPIHLTNVSYRTKVPGVLVKKQHSYVPCGKCPACLSRKRQDWITRLSEESYSHNTCYFITLTYDNEHLNYPDDVCSETIFPTLRKKDFQDFMKRFRKHFKNKIKYYAIGEYGTEYMRPHMHFLLFADNLHFDTVSDYVCKSWTLGMYNIGFVEPKSISYVTDYCITKYDERLQTYIDTFNLEKPFMICSHGIGLDYVKTNNKNNRFNSLRPESFYYTDVNGLKHSMPRYLKDKIFDKYQLAAVTEWQTENLEVEDITDDIRDTFVRKANKKLTKHTF